MTKTLLAISYGGGVQSTALLIMAANRDAEFEEVMGGQCVTALFANVGDDSEDPASLEWIRNVTQPWAAQRGVWVRELQRRKSDGQIETVWSRIMDPGSKRVGIPVRMSNGAPAGRSCTADFKVAVIGKFLKQYGASKDNPATVAIGFSTDEFQRANNKKAPQYQNTVYPLLEMGWDRSRCQQLIVDTFGQSAPQSSCFFCPYHKRSTWAEMRRDRPELFAKSVELETTINQRRAENGMDQVWLTDRLRPLDEAIGEAQTPLFTDDGPEGCDDGNCWT
jgi:hypothetical protein